MTSVTEVVNRIQKSAEKIISDQTQKVGTVSVGDAIRQGDIYPVCIGSLPKSAKRANIYQLAPGNSQGSRHILDTEACEVYTADPEEVISLIKKAMNNQGKYLDQLRSQLIGPLFVFRKEEQELTHPQHGNFVLPEGEVFATVYQRAWAEEVRRQLD